MNIEKESLGTIIRKKRMQLNLTQQQLADQSEITQAHISRIESGEYNPSSVTICKLAKALDIPVIKLLEAVEKKAV